MSKILVLVGPPASGKSTFAKTFVEHNPTYRRLNKDDIRKELFLEYVYTKENEEIVIKEELRRAVLYINQGLDIIIDDTNVSIKHINQWIDISKSYNYEIEFELFNTSLEECIERDSKRQPNEGYVGESVITHLHEGFKQVSKVINKIVLDKRIFYAKENNSSELKHCIILDIDGTVSLMYGRIPYDSSKLLEDIPNWPLINILKLYIGDIIVVTGREEKSLEDTKEFLKQCGLTCDKFYFRKDGDQIHDYEFKEKIYNEHIKGKYIVDGVFEDRNRLVDMYRNKLGLPCYQVNYGDF